MRGLSALLLLAGMAAAPAIAQGERPVRVGVLTDMSGVYGTITGKGAVEAARMAVEDFKAGHPGFQVELVSADHQNKPDVAVALARQWMDVDGVDAVAELTTSAIALAVQKLAEEKKKIVLVSGAGSSDLTGKACSPTGFHWTYDTYALANGTGRAVLQQGGRKWFFLTVDYAFGQALEKDVSDTVKAMGGEVVGGVRHPLNTADFSSFLLQAQGSKADVIGLANAGSDLVNSIKQATEFGIGQSSQRLAALLVYITDVHALGLDQSKGVYLTTGFYWDRDEATRAWSRRFFDRVGAMPTMAQAGMYSSVSHYLQAVKKAGTRDAVQVARTMKSMPVNDMFATNGVVREDGRMVHDMYLVRVKQPSASRYPWDYYEVVQTIPGREAFRPMEGGGCPHAGK
ncbi:ABC transporter substrate-binding protein [Enterovirga aerilata]|uniref:ABC transporter substrate-binding protein n=1 Tax=Enterovirga aerilata TaxID=2730920 RepID=A0A849IFW1_9HYPH|nr:ABC transporter substrate-binding protein [Enterovirga sp. DB1703]NNM72803.1 ABC transporter substrate-binding protein [Enterovirga sp. DB1703]